MSITGGPFDLTASQTTPEFETGQTYYDGSTGKTYCYVQNKGADAIAAADVVGAFLTTPAHGHVSVTAATQLDETDGTTTRVLVAGVALGAIASASYGWIQVGGFCASMTTDGNVLAGHPLVCADGAKTASPASTAASAHLANFGKALIDDVSTALTKSYIRTYLCP